MGKDDLAGKITKLSAADQKLFHEAAKDFGINADTSLHTTDKEARQASVIMSQLTGIAVQNPKKGDLGR